MPRAFVLLDGKEPRELLQTALPLLGRRVVDPYWVDGPPTAGEPVDILTWAAARFAPRIAFATAFGAEGCALIDMIARHRLPIDIFTLDTGLLFKETYALWQRLQDRYRVRIRAVRPLVSLDQQAAQHGERLWERDPDRCCALRKVEPLRRALADFDAWITSVRPDQTAHRVSALAFEPDPRFGLAKVNPLVGWSRQQVSWYLRLHDVPTNPLHQQGYPSIGCHPCTTPVADGEDPRSGRWRGFAKTECGLHLRPSGEGAA
jgi:phosphoadenosine phosphosulfate reductase